MVCIIPKKQETICFNRWSYLKYSGNSNRCSTGFCSRTPPFLLYINDLNISIKNSRAYHIADDTNILLSDKSLELLAKKLNQDLKSLSQWLKASKFSLNVKKTELIIFCPKNTKLDYGIKFKLNGRRLTPISAVKYLGILLDEHLLWTKQINWVN